MLTKEQLCEKIAAGLFCLDGATGSNLRKAGMPKEACTEEWVLAHPETILSLQRQYAAAGSQILYAPTFQAQPIALERVCLDRQTEAVNAQLVALSKAAAPDRLIAGDLTTLAAFTESWNPDNFDLLVENYRRQIRGLIDGGADLLVAETNVSPGSGSHLYSCGIGASRCCDVQLHHDRRRFPVLRSGCRTDPAGTGTGRCCRCWLQLCLSRHDDSLSCYQTAQICPGTTDLQAQCRQSCDQCPRNCGIQHDPGGICLHHSRMQIKQCHTHRRLLRYRSQLHCPDHKINCNYAKSRRIFRRLF